MKTIGQIAVVLLVCGGSALGADNAADFPFEGVVTANHVNVRSGPDLNWYPVSRLMMGDRMRVVDEEFGWYKIVPPARSFSWVSQSEIGPISNGKGTVISPRAVVRAGSRMEAYADRRTAIQTQLREGTTVTVVGSSGQWYKIAPPEGAYVWISGQYVRRATARRVEPVAVRPSSGEVAGVGVPSTQPVVTTRVSTTAPTTRQMTQPSDDIFGQFSEKLAALDEAFAAEGKKPLLQQHWGPLLAGYRQIAAQKETDPFAAAYSRQHVLAIEYQVKAQDGYRSMLKIHGDFEKLRLVSEAHLAELRAAKLGGTPKVWQAEGILEPSRAFKGPRMPNRYRLYDPRKEALHRTVAYVDLVEGSKIHVDPYLGKYVAVSGPMTYDPELRIHVIKATSIVLRTAPTEKTEQEE